MILLRRMSLWLALAGVAFTIVVLAAARQKDPMPPPVAPPPSSPFAKTVAASGIIESINENVRIAPPVPGLVTTVFVAVGDRVRPGDPLLQLDDRELRAQLATREAAIAPLKAQVEEQRYRIADLEVQLRRLESIHDRRAVSEDDLKRTYYALEVAKRAQARFESSAQQALAQRDETKMLLDRLTVRAPRGGEVLQVNVRAGEYAVVGAAEPLMLLGDTERLQVRADVDEVNAPLVPRGAPAMGYVKGGTEHAIPLRFVRIEPYVVPKRSLTGDNSERVDTRVLQIIYRFDRPPFPVYAGQQLDVFIQRDGTTPSPLEATSSPEASR